MFLIKLIKITRRGEEEVILSVPTNPKTVNPKEVIDKKQQCKNKPM
jgi:hypothetical protein